MPTSSRRRGSRRRSGRFRLCDRIFSPLITLWVFLGQVLNADPSCCQVPAVARPCAPRPRRGSSRGSQTVPTVRPASRLPDHGSSPRWPAWPGRDLDERVNGSGCGKAAASAFFDGSTVLDARHDGEPPRTCWPTTRAPGTNFDRPHRG